MAWSTFQKYQCPDAVPEILIEWAEAKPELWIPNTATVAVRIKWDAE